MFALGDVSTASEAKFASFASKFQSEVVVANVRALLADGETKTYEPFPEALIVPIGPFGGAGQVPGQDGLAPATTSPDLADHASVGERRPARPGAELAAGLPE